MPIKLFISDFDRTLTDEILEVDGECMNHLKILKERGIKVATVSGRRHSVMKIFYERYSDAVDCFVSENGCIGYLDGKKRILSKNEKMKEIMEYLRSDAIPYKIGEIVISVPTMYHLKIDKLISVHQNLRVIKNIDSFMILPKDASKGTGIRWLQSSLGISKDETVCIGDGENDIIMRDFCSFLGAPANAVDEMKKKADYVCKNHYSKGTIEFIEKVLSMQA
jgi:phosphoglycolate phosphatase (TIGR01487 family)